MSKTSQFSQLIFIPNSQNRSQFIYIFLVSSKKLLKSSTYWLEKTRKDPSEEVFPPEASGSLLEYEEFKKGLLEHGRSG